MEGSKLFVEVYSKEVEISCACLQGSIVVPENIVKVCRSFGSNRSHLFVAASVSRDEEYWDTFDLLSISNNLSLSRGISTLVSSSTITSR